MNLPKTFALDADRRNYPVSFYWGIIRGEDSIFSFGSSAVKHIPNTRRFSCFWEKIMYDTFWGFFPNQAGKITQKEN